MLYRYSEAAEFPGKLKPALRDCVLNYRYWHDESGSDTVCYEAESDSILFHVCEILAGQRYPDQLFSNTDQTGQWHSEKGETLALEWLHKRGTRGFSEWDSNDRFERDLAALSLLVDFCRNEQVWGLAAVVMDKMLLTMALNSFKGVFGSKPQHQSMAHCANTSCGKGENGLRHLQPKLSMKSIGIDFVKIVLFIIFACEGFYNSDIRKSLLNL